MTDLYAKALPAGPKKKRVPRRCSTCADRTCRQRGIVCDWKHCGKWKPKKVSLNTPLPPPPPKEEFPEPNKPENPFKRGTLRWSLLEGDWSDLTVPEIAETLGTSPLSIVDTIYYIRHSIGYSVPYRDRHRSEYKTEQKRRAECLSK